MKLSIEQIRATLEQYGANVTSGFQIVRNDKPLGILIVQRKGRIRFEDADSKALYMSGPIKPETIENFVEKFWFWQKKNV